MIAGTISEASASSYCAWVILPFAAYPDGSVKVYTDPDHAGESFYRDDEMHWPPAPETL